jgi:chromate transport protein ChrA
MNNLLSFFKGLGVTLAIYITVLVTPALVGVVLTGRWSMYTDLINSGDYVAIMSFIALLVLLVYWACESDN